MLPDFLHISNEDNMALMSRYQDNHFDVAIVDPPYGIGDSWSKNRKDRFFQNGKLHTYQNTEAPSFEFFEELKRVSKNQIIWGGNYFTEFLEPTNSWIVWNKKRKAAKTFMSEAELAWTSYKKVMRIADFLWDGCKKCEKVSKWHPHQKPWSLYEWVISEYCSREDKILDTNLGSMSIALAVDHINRINGWSLELTGCELEPHYYESGIKKLGLYMSQTKIMLNESL
ncbi:DNA methyltransferase [Flagellimonas sp. S174]|uniref:DNA methyltransferase n=1 Tax=Flagellimonas sp. S174 TaxID=3410790 RepID=UPI003BF57806